MSRRERERTSLAVDLPRLLGRAAPEPMGAAARAAALAAEWHASRAAALPDEWAIVARMWESADEVAMVDTLHRLSRNVAAASGGAGRPTWILWTESEAHAAALASDAVLDNPLGFAAMADGELRLLDQAVPGGLWLRRHGRLHDDGVTFTWELEVWGEPWLSATTRAFRGVG